MDCFQKALIFWNRVRPLIEEGYAVLDKTLVLGLPATSMPASTPSKDTGIGSPYGSGAQRIWHFWHDFIHKIIIGPIGKTEAKTWHSPYLASWDYNPFFVNLEALVKKGWLKRQTLQQIYRHKKQEGYINFLQVERDYMQALTEAHQTSKTTLSFTRFCNKIIQEQMRNCPYPYIGDIPINIPQRISDQHPDWFLKDWSMGAPPDQYSNTPQIWGFPVLKPDALVEEKKGRLGPAGRTLKKLLHFYFSGNTGGIRLDHFIGWVNPYCFYTGTKKYANGRLYSSPDIPVLKKYALNNESDFLKMAQEFLIPFIKKFHLSSMDIYPEDLGIRPPQMDFVLDTLHFGKMLPVQFNDPNQNNHIYHIAHSRHQDILVLDTHDSPSLMEFFETIPPAQRQQFAQQLAADLRFHFTDDLSDPKWLYRMQWAAALAAPAKRITVFFTTLMGQSGRYNIPGLLDSWHLRCRTNFEQEYFLAFKKGQAYNPFEAIRWAIYARGDAFYQTHAPLVQKLSDAEQALLNILKAL